MNGSRGISRLSCILETGRTVYVTMRCLSSAIQKEGSCLTAGAAPSIWHYRKWINVVNGFMNSQAEFMGFLARKKENGRWLWYEGQGWQPLSGDNVTRRLFLDGVD